MQPFMFFKTNLNRDIMNTPYRKVYENGILKNPITKSNPYRSKFPNRRARRAKIKL